MSLPGVRSSGDRLFLWSLALTLVLKLGLAALVPLTGDEAYYTAYGEYPDYGYYDHGPVIGWWLSVVLALGKTVWLVRLPAVFATLAVGVLLWHMLRTIDVEKAGIAAAIYLWSPHNALFVFTTTDAPLIFFSAVAGIFAFHAYRTDHACDYLLAGFFLGLAFLSKYFAVLLGLAFAVLFLFGSKPPRIRGLLLIFLAVLPAAAVNLAWNYQNGWINLVFYFYTRQRGNGASVLNVVEFVAFTLLLMGPLVYFLVRPRLAGRAAWSQARRNGRETGLIVFLAAFLVPLALLLLVSLGRKIGLHWSLSFFPFFFAALPVLFDAAVLRRMARAMFVFSGGLALVAGVGVMLPVELARSHKSYGSIVLATHPDEVLAAMKPYWSQYRLATPSYVKSAMLSFFAPQHVPVIGLGSPHGRQDDLLTDLRSFDGQNVMIMLDRKHDADAPRAWFRETEIRTITVRGAEFRLLLCREFRFAAYRDAVLSRIAEAYYRLPPWLAAWSDPRPTYLPERYGIRVTPAEPPAPVQARRR